MLLFHGTCFSLSWDMQLSESKSVSVKIMLMLNFLKTEPLQRGQFMLLFVVHIQHTSTSDTLTHAPSLFCTNTELHIYKLTISIYS